MKAPETVFTSGNGSCWPGVSELDNPPAAVILIDAPGLRPPLPAGRHQAVPHRGPSCRPILVGVALAHGPYPSGLAFGQVLGEDARRA